MLLEDPREALDYVKGISSGYQNNYPIKNFIRCMLVNGKENGIRHWHSKLLCALVLVIQNMGKDSCSIASHADINILSIDMKISRVRGEAITNEYLNCCSALMSQEDQFLSSFHVQMYKFIKRLNIDELASFMDSIHTAFYHDPLRENPNGFLSQVKRLHPLPLVLQLICDGHISDHKNLKTIFQDMAPLGFEEYYNNIKPDEFPSKEKFLSKTVYKMVPVPKEGEGRKVQKGDCLIISQTFTPPHNVYNIHRCWLYRKIEFFKKLRFGANILLILSHLLNLVLPKSATISTLDPGEQRFGAERDERSLVGCMRTIGCKNRITLERDLTKDKIFECIGRFKEKIAVSLPDFTVIVIMSHGQQNPITGDDEFMDINMEGVSLSAIVDNFIDANQCRVMIGKPKLFFTQFCRAKPGKSEFASTHR